MRLKFYDPSDYYSLIEQYMLSQEQLLYTLSPMASLKLSETDVNRHAILAKKGEKLVTFFVLHENEGVKPYSENNQAILIRGFSTDMHEQGKGYAKEALQLLPTFVRLHFPTINELVLGVNFSNTAAQALYKKCGFVDEGICAVGIKGELKVMSYYLQSDH
ncbi:GNAT family N-acetyltransferase [Lysinibacillus mangiferihumi]|uniref:GNAT family N-acetyltransferase n=1 Tax=Lysinibacillus mangiferihumi TaxID=1130819 RepID=A0A4V5TP13_9BACI|nr:GNAT family protein [Lysinibacillus mangiferihumi]TKI69173.1 GNAT family N-acetyltransferase [Lysinibacillus mangiferihumi]